ncbi:MAG: polyprenyl synthetase family protein [Sphingobacteriaceae bacterium]|nr:polyprenyl synthetase family protein [Sphingobacteriaceae bacterium]
MDTFETHLQLFNSHLENYKADVNLRSPRELYEPEHYILSLGGKRLRPLLALISCDLFGKDPSLALNSALCVELFHNFSLIHDDILDEAPLRRNNPTVHIKWNTNIAILSGDVMLVKAFEVLKNYEAKEFSQLFSIFSKTSIEVCEGQQLDMNFESSSGGENSVTVDDYIQMITKKTAVLLGCSLQMGAINAGASSVDQEHIYEFGKHLGIAFQLLDDTLDAYSTDEKSFGKQIGGDIIANKKTFLVLKTLELANVEQAKKLNELMSKNKGDNAKKIQSVLTVFNELGVKALCEAEADKHTKIAIDHLMKVNADRTKLKALENFSLALLKRNI